MLCHCVSVKVQRFKCFLSCSAVVSWHNCIKWIIASLQTSFLSGYSVSDTLRTEKRFPAVWDIRTKGHAWTPEHNRYFFKNPNAIHLSHFYVDHETISSKQGTTFGSTSVRNLFAMIGPSVDTLRMWGMSEIPYTQTLCRHLPWHVRLLQAQVARTIGSDIQERRCLTMYPDSGLQSILSIIVRVWRKCSSVCPLSRLQSRKILLTGWQRRNQIQYLSRIPLLCPL